DNSTIQSGDAYSWDFESDGTIDDVTGGSKTFTYPAAGTYTATLSIDRGGCVATTTATVTVDDVGTATAGPAQTICEAGTAALIATVGGTASTGAWSTAGDGVFDNVSALDPVYTPGATDISTGNATVTFTTDDPPGTCTPAAATTDIIIQPAATVSAGADQNICTGAPVALSGTDGGSAFTATWSTSGDGTFNDVNALNATYTPGPNDLTNGSADLHLTTDDPAGPCVAAEDEMIVLISNTATVDAGPDIVICGNGMATLNGTTGGPATTFSWSTSGDGTFDDNTILNAAYTPGPNDQTSGNAVLTLTTDPVGACLSQNDQCAVTITRAISLAPQTLNATIANTVSVSVTAGGSFNAGDVLTSTILASPKKGTAQLQAGNMLQYVANSGTVGNDTVYVQVCNQCNQCDAQYIRFSIQNAPPVINIPPATTQAGSILVISISASISDDNGNIDLSTATIVQQPSSGATASIDEFYNLVLDYGNVPNFNGTDNMTIEVCDDLDACAQHILTIQVGIISGEVVVHNAVAPKSSGDNRYMRILNLPSGNKVTIFNRWGDMVFEVEDYDNDAAGKRFEGNNESGSALPSGIYFYKIEIAGTSTRDGELITGFLALKQ
ncbi:MAG: gliding motility-associated C-terminal domain-containing protein, partial [Cyclobacteriaceae bacterium]